MVSRLNPKKKHHGPLEAAFIYPSLHEKRIVTRQTPSVDVPSVSEDKLISHVPFVPFTCRGWRGLGEGATLQTVFRSRLKGQSSHGRKDVHTLGENTGYVSKLHLKTLNEERQ